MNRARSTTDPKRDKVVQQRNQEAQAWNDREKKVHALLDEAWKIASGDVIMVTTWLDGKELEGYGYTVERDEQIRGLEEEKENRASFFPVTGAGCQWDWEGFLASRTLAEQIKMEEFFLGMVEARRNPEPFAALQPAVPPAEIVRVVFDPIAQEIRALRDILNNSPDEDGDTEKKALFLIRNWDALPLEALEWIARVEKGEEPPATPDHVEAIALLREAGRLVGGLFTCTGLEGQARRVLRDELQRDHQDLQGKVQAHLDRFTVPAHVEEPPAQVVPPSLECEKLSCKFWTIGNGEGGTCRNPKRCDGPVWPLYTT